MLRKNSYCYGRLKLFLTFSVTAQFFNLQMHQKLLCFRARSLWKCTKIPQLHLLDRCGADAELLRQWVPNWGTQADVGRHEKKMQTMVGKQPDYILKLDEHWHRGISYWPKLHMYGGCPVEQTKLSYQIRSAGHQRIFFLLTAMFDNTLVSWIEPVNKMQSASSTSKSTLKWDASSCTLARHFASIAIDNNENLPHRSGGLLKSSFLFKVQ